METPKGERFLAWSSAHGTIDGDVAATASWDLIGIDEATFAD